LGVLTGFTLYLFIAVILKFTFFEIEGIPLSEIDCFVPRNYAFLKGYKKDAVSIPNAKACLIKLF
tara:strand:+ start:1882 stop:2076 length:195 start_codon:yes stop_codon:yes gene_type:complete